MGKWMNPLDGYNLTPTRDSTSFMSFASDETGVPYGAEHPGAFGFKRKNHTHEGVDLYVREGTRIKALEDGVVVAMFMFTGESAGYPFWEETIAILVEGVSGVICYGELDLLPECHLGQHLKQGDAIGKVKRVLKKDKGRPMSMLHLELHEHGTRFCPEWTDISGRPFSLKDPTDKLLEICDSNV